ncbi:chromate transporter [Lyngbya confervoides]|uniref:Chromate transporter n=1 Tax=Lyngbya confervoides BDU141951 TaxID=1574623 RepID=A0ABD4T2P1_9CYAN|nr:chromate transporter [Lyngbya confervoides]MCM1982891.1 chromate transporter [Lyngbya confervoides BDU141951]
MSTESSDPSLKPASAASAASSPDPGASQPGELRGWAKLVELAWVFGRLGTLAFGGPAAHIAMMDEEVVRRRQWMSPETLLDLMGLTSLIPGPNSTELAIHIGYSRAGWSGLWIAGISFMLPAVSLVGALAVLYQRYQTVPQLAGWLSGIQAVIIAIILQAVWTLGRKAVRDRTTALVAIAALVGFALGINELLLLLICGIAVLLVRLGQTRFWPGLLFPLGTSPWATLPKAPDSPQWTAVFWVFLKVGSVLYGSGYVLFAFLQRDLVERWHWLTAQQLLDAIAVGQMTPGPVLTTATFVGYLVAGFPGAIAATIGIFLPAFLLVGLITPWISTLRTHPSLRAFLDGVNVASLALMVGVTYTLARTAVVSPVTLALALVAMIAIFGFKVRPPWVLLLGALGGGAAQFFNG